MDADRDRESEEQKFRVKDAVERINNAKIKKQFV